MAQSKKVARQKKHKKARTIAGNPGNGTGLPSGTDAGRLISF